MNNINERMAKVMGWRKGKGVINVFSGNREVYWRNNADEAKYNINKWHPDTSIEQAMMCAEKLKPYEISISCPHVVIADGKSLYIVNLFLLNGETKTGQADTMELAICEAILEVMDENNIIPLNLDMEDKDE